MSSRLEIATYRPKPGLIDMLSSLLRHHQNLLHQRGLINAGHKPCIVLDDETAIEVIEYKDEDSRKLSAVDPEILRTRRFIAAHADAVSRIDLG